MAIYQVRTFSDIYNYVLAELKVQSSDTTSLNRIKRIVNAVYLDEVVPYESWEWLSDSIDLQVDSKINAGTATVSQNSTDVTLTSAPGNSVKGYLFSSEGHNEVYRVAQHTAGSTTITLESPFTGTSASTQSYSLWNDRLALPGDCREVFGVYHDYDVEPLKKVGITKLSKLRSIQPKKEARPRYFALGDWTDPAPYASVGSLPALSTRASSGLVRTLTFASTVASLLAAGDRIEISGSADKAFNGKFVISSVSSATVTYTGRTILDSSAAVDAGLTLKLLSNETDDERYRELILYPARYDKKTTLHIDYVKEALPLENDDDEPVIPIGDRIVLAYGTLMQAWRSIGRNPEEAATSAQLYDRKLAKMQGKADSQNEKPTLSPSRDYLSAKRAIRRVRSGNFSDFFQGVSSADTSQDVIKGTASRLVAFDSNGDLGASTLTYSGTVVGFSGDFEIGALSASTGYFSSDVEVAGSLDVTGALTSGAFSASSGYFSGEVTMAQTSYILGSDTSPDTIFFIPRNQSATTAANGVKFRFDASDSGGTNRALGRFGFEKEQGWTGTASTRDSAFVVDVYSNGTVFEGFRVGSDRKATIAGAASIGNELLLANPATVTQTTSIASSSKIVLSNHTQAITLTLPDATEGQTIIVKDISGGASGNNITITRAGADTVDGSQSTSITTDYGVARLVAGSGTAWYTI